MNNRDKHIVLDFTFGDRREDTIVTSSICHAGPKLEQIKEIRGMDAWNLYLYTSDPNYNDN